MSEHLHIYPSSIIFTVINALLDYVYIYMCVNIKINIDVGSRPLLPKSWRRVPIRVIGKWFAKIDSGGMCEVVVVVVFFFFFIYYYYYYYLLFFSFIVYHQLAHTYLYP
jgi:hypothetical protein